MPLKVFNTLGRRIEEFVPLNPPRVGVYVCGPTVYGHSHLGHAKSYVSFDTIIRWLRAVGYDVNYVQNITDVGHLTDDADEGEDKIIVEARRRGLHPMAVVEHFMRSYFEDMGALNVTPADIVPRATGHIPEQIELTRKLIETGHAYEVKGSVYFDVTSYPEYGKLSGRRLEELEAGSRVAVNDEKRNPADFALWKRAEAGHIMRWPSPWGEGFPGWHLECSAMSQKYLGLTFDIHGGGLENQFPHHECEIAQSEAAHGVPFVRYWLHNNMVTLNGQKMGKSLGNAISLKDIFHAQEAVRGREGQVLLEKSFEPVVVRHFILASHYRSPLDFSSEALRAAESGSYKLRDAVRELSRAAQAGGARTPSAASTAGKAAEISQQVGDAIRSPEPGQMAPFAPRAQSSAVRDVLADVEKRFSDAMNDDFNTAAAIAAVFEFVKQAGAWVRESAPREDLAAADALLSHLTHDILGFRWKSPLGGDEAGPGSKQDQVIGVLVELRNEARRSKNFALSDDIRNRLAAIGIELKDGAQGTTW